MLIPNVIEQTPRGERFYDIFTKLLQHRIVFIAGPIDDIVSNIVVAQFLHLDHEDPDKPIQVYINTQGGLVTAGLAIYDTMQLIRSEVRTFCLGMAFSMGAVLLAAGTKGKRFALPNCKVLLHQPMGGFSGQATDIGIQATEILRTRDRLNEILALHTGQPLERIQKDTDRDFYMSAQEAKEYGVVDEVVKREAEKRK
jgi:ATP-dependent Clp protease protease subunit